ncbi:hypothetical protein RJ639_029849 [Escallonia herrerae]|uniref:Retrotransposon gag domain-containing protein n=1 Tax=Escallonia herrerae TaxID=1293975 RepID=A0AA88WXH2_9ASTE|nr:hypothetical protein RJ639_029849 [Escallonia herrerae]
MYLTDTIALWWRRRYTDGCDVKTWEKFKHELQRQFYPENAEDMAMINLRWLRQKGSIHKYVKEYSALMLEIPEMSERQRLCFFIYGLQQWSATALQRRELHDLTSAMVIVERLGDFKQRERPRSPRHDCAKERGDSRSKSGSPKATDDKLSRDKGHRHHHKRKKKHEGSRKQGDSRDYKAHVGPRGGCFYCADPYYRKDCPHKGKMIAFINDREARIWTLQMVNAFVQKSKEEIAKKKKSKKRWGLLYATMDVVGKT